MSAIQTEYEDAHQRLPDAGEEWLSFDNAYSQHFGEAIKSGHPVRVSEIIRFYESKLQAARLAAETEKSDRLIVQACENRELVAAQMDEDWLGMKLLAHLRESPGAQASELALMTDTPVDAVASILARLARAGAVAVQHRQFACTEKGTEMLNELEANTGISLTP
jgi:predicted methyltransferase